MKFLLSNQETERLRFRKLEPADFTVWLELFRDDETSKLLGMQDFQTPEERCKKWFEWTFHRYENNLGGQNALIYKDTNQLVGQCGLLVREVDHKFELEIAYSILPDFRQKGFAYESARKCKEFAFEKWNDWDNELFDQIMNSLMKKTKEFHYSIKGYDKAPSAVMKGKDNMRNANLDEYITISEQNFFDTQKENQGPLHMVFNPPYGERLDIHLERFYREIGDTLKQNYPNTNAWFITANLEALKYVGLKPSRKIKLFNGSLEARLVKYEMYEGSKRTKFNSLGSGSVSDERDL